MIFVEHGSLHVGVPSVSAPARQGRAAREVRFPNRMIGKNCERACSFRE
ncbi:hypothetical protein Pd630_LPD00712 [Rhodococcus opacus PD630]|nr:hypothetical protein Pd630_LPD00712 [Rhodococcus opacus PD630]